MDWKAGDWCVFEMKVGQIKRVEDDGSAEFSDGSFATSGRLRDRFRPLTLRNKSIAENFHIYYDRLRDINGEAGFNYPDIFTHFSNLMLKAIDGEDNQQMYDEAQAFIRDARDYKTPIQGVALFRPKLRSASVRT